MRKLADSAPLCPVCRGARCAILLAESPVRRKSSKQTNTVWRTNVTKYLTLNWGLERHFSVFVFFFTLKEKCRCKEYEVSRQLLQQPHGFSGLYTVSRADLLDGRRSGQVRIDLFKCIFPLLSRLIHSFSLVCVCSPNSVVCKLFFLSSTGLNSR